MRIPTVVLAAGRGERMRGVAPPGGKHLLKVDGEAMLTRVISQLAQSHACRVSVVLRRDDLDGRRLVEPFEVDVLTPDPGETGRASSVRAAIAGLRPDDAGVLIALADQPFLLARDFDVLIAEFAVGSKGIIRASYAGRPGNPVLFARRYAKELLALRAGQGGRDVIRAHPEDLRSLELDPQRGRDLDRPEDL
ncbi:MAG: nucleotidyltransferase family protein [bacterium]|nr:nucleotidyltransferase family protein [bacterium]